jgi:hypothetical protein
LVACTVLLGLTWTAPLPGEARNQVSASPSTQGVAPRPVGLPTQRVAPWPDSLRAAKLLQSVALGDFNGDGIMDFAVADFLSDNILVMLGDGEGHLRLAATLPSGSGPRSIVAGDFNHDGLMDLAVANFFSGDVTIFIGHGDGSFEDPQPIHLAPGLSSLAVADFDSDGSLDLVAANFLSGALTVLKGAPDGSFAVEATLGPATAVSLVYVRDFNGDGHQDLIAVDASGKQAWLFAGNGHGAFQPGQSIGPQVAASRLATQPPATATTAASSQLPAIAKAAGDGQLAYHGTVLPGNLVAAATGPKGGVAAQEPLFFSSLYGGASVMGSSPTSANGQGQVSTQVTVSSLPGINFVATSASGGAAAVFGEASVLQSAAFFQQVESALFPPPQTPASLPGRQLLNKAQSQLKSNDVVGAVVTLENCLELLAPAESQPSAVPTATGAAIDLLRRLLNQLILFGPDVSGGITCGQTVSGTLAAAQTDYYAFTANAGEVITWASQATSNRNYGFNTCADLYNASSTQIAPEVCNGVNAPFTIQTTGTYTFVVHDVSYSHTGNYNLNLQFLTGQCAGSSSCGQINSGTLVAAQQDVYSFSANASEVITWASQATSNRNYGFNTCADLYNASGTEIESGPCNGASAPFTILTTGTYIFVVHDAGYYNQGSYNLDLQFLTGRCAGSISCAQTSNGTLVAAQQDVYSFSANASEVITWASQATSNRNYGFNTCADLYNASGTEIESGPCNGAIAPFTILTTGTYAFVVHDAGYYNQGNYNLNLQFPTGRCATSISCGQIKSGTLVTAQQDAYSFSANAGEVITFPSQATSNRNYGFNTCADLYNALGTKIASNPCNGVNAPFTIPTTAGYIFVVHDVGYYNQGNYNLNLQFLTGRCAGSISCAQTSNGTLVTTQQDVYSFSANASEVITWASQATSNRNYGFNTCADLYNASGTEIESGPCNGAIAPFTILTTGTYAFVVHDAGYYNQGNYNLNLQFPTGRCATSISCGQIKSGTLVTAQQDAYSFSANAGEVITFPSQATSNRNYGFNTCADLYNALGTKIASNPCNGVNAPFTIPTTAGYIFVVHDVGYYNQGNYNLNLQFPTGRCAISSGCGQINSRSLVTAQQDVYSFSAQAGEVITVASQATSNRNYGFNTCVDLYNASGTMIASDASCNGVSASITIPTFGAYMFLVHDAGYYNTGNYNANWTFTLGCPAVTGFPAGLNCGTQVLNTSSVSKTLTLANSGIQPLTVLGITNQGANAGDFALNTNCGTSVAAGANCSIGVTFTPTGPGPRKTALTIIDNAINNNAIGTPRRVLLTGVGTAVSLSPESLNFGNQTVGTTSNSKQITVTNEGSATVNFFEIALGGANPGDFSQSGTCGSTLAPAATCTVNVTFKPTATGARTASVLFSDNGGGNLQSVGLTGTGQ